MLVGAYLNIIVRNADVLTLANQAQLVNTLPAMVCETGGTGFYRQATSYVQEMFAPAAGQTAVDSWIDSPGYDGGYYPRVPWLDVSATYDEQTGEVRLHVVNRSPDETYPLEVTAPDRALTPTSAWTLGDAPLDTANSFDQPNQLTITGQSVADGKIVVAPACVLVVRLT